MTTILNKTQRPLSISLPQGKTLHLGPGKTGEIASSAVARPQMKKLVEAGEIEILGEGEKPTQKVGGGNRGRMSAGHSSAAGARRSGDR